MAGLKNIIAEKVHRIAGLIKAHCREGAIVDRADKAHDGVGLETE